jgi:cytochrome c-type biogenesis protein CcmH/NrfG
VDARYVLARLWAKQGRFGPAVRELDVLLAIAPADSGAARLRREILAAATRQDAASPLGDVSPAGR